MLNKEQILFVLKENKAILEERYGVKKIGLFGSYARNQRTPESDVDIYVEIEKRSYQTLLDVLLFLEGRLETKVGLVYKREEMRPSFLRTLENETIYA